MYLMYRFDLKKGGRERTKLFFHITQSMMREAIVCGLNICYYNGIQIKFYMHYPKPGSFKFVFVMFISVF